MIFWDRRILSIFILGILSGLPWVMIGSALTLWLKEAGISRTEIGYAGLITAVYAVNCFWSPLLDQIRPKLPFKMGPRRVWILLCQVVIALACLLMSSLSPSVSTSAIVFTGLLIAITSATQDIAIDAYRVDQFDASQARLISAAAAAATAGWWTGYAGLGFIPLWLSDLGWSWPALYLLLAAISLAFSTILFFSPDPPSISRVAHNRIMAENITLMYQTTLRARYTMIAWLASPLLLALWSTTGAIGLPEHVRQGPLFVPLTVAVGIVLLIMGLHQLSVLKKSSNPYQCHQNDHFIKAPAWLITTVLAPFDDFFLRNGLRLAITLLLFIVIFKLGESMLGRMSIVFYKEIGFSNTQIAAYSKILTWVVTIVAAIPCAILNAHFGIVKGLFISGLFMAASNLMFVVIAIVGPDTNWYIATVIVDGLTAAWSSVAFVSFISMLCSHAFSATQYALLASLGALGRSTLAAFSGQMVDALDGNWTLFFIATAVMVIPGLVLLLTINRQIKAAADHGT